MFNVAMGQSSKIKKQLALVGQYPVGENVETDDTTKDIILKFSQNVFVQVSNYPPNYIGIRDTVTDEWFEKFEYMEGDDPQYFGFAITSDNMLRLTKRYRAYPKGKRLYLDIYNYSNNGVILDSNNNIFDAIGKFTFVTDYEASPITSMNYLSKTKTSIRLTINIPDGMQVLVLVKKGTSSAAPSVFDFSASSADSCFMSLPTTNLSYALAQEIDGVNSNGGDFKALYAGSDTDITITGLTGSTYYRIQALTYNNAGTLAFNRTNTANNTLAIKTNAY